MDTEREIKRFKASKEMEEALVFIYKAFTRETNRTHMKDVANACYKALQASGYFEFEFEDINKV